LTPSTFFFDMSDLLYTDPDSLELEAEHPFAFAAKAATDPTDSPTLAEV
jgi:hypothetical protein